MSSARSCPNPRRSRRFAPRSGAGRGSHCMNTVSAGSRSRSGAASWGICTGPSPTCPSPGAPPTTSSLPGGVDVVRADLSDPKTLDECLDGVDAVFPMWPGLPVEHASVALDAVTKNARRIVFLSSFTVRDDLEQQTDPITAFHADIEHLIEQSGLEWTFLRCGGFATNALMWAPQIRADGVVRWPYGAAARSLIHERDIAAVAVRALIG